MKLLVTGGAGFIGSNFIHYWLKNYPQDVIFNLDKLTYAGNLDNLKEIKNRSNYSFVQGDICDEKLLDKLISQVHTVIHFAAESHVDRSILNSFEFIKTNVEGTRALLDACLRHKIKRFHHVTTDEVFGSLSLKDEPFSELSPYDPRSPYSASKAGSDHLVRSYFYTHKLPITISNCSNNFGPYQHPEKLIPRFITNLLLDKKLPIYGQGLNIRDWLHVSDHVKGIEAILNKGRIGETYCLGGNSEKTNLEITKHILKLMNKSEDYIDYVDDRLGHDFRYAVSFKKSSRELSWQPKMNFTEALVGTINWYKENKSWWEKLKI